MELWKKEVEGMKIPITRDVDLRSVVGNKVKIEIWKGL